MAKTKSSNKVILLFIIVTSNIEMKQSELTKMNELEEKMKVIFEKMN